MSRDKPDYSHLAPKGQIWVAWKSHTKIRYNDLASTGTPVDAGSFFFTHIDLPMRCRGKTLDGNDMRMEHMDHTMCSSFL